MSKDYSAHTRRITGAESFDDLSRARLSVENDHKLSKAERIMLDKAAAERRQYLARAAVTI